jgi:hypothetical protein
MIASPKARYCRWEPQVVLSGGLCEPSRKRDASVHVDSPIFLKVRDTEKDLPASAWDGTIWLTSWAPFLGFKIIDEPAGRGLMVCRKPFIVDSIHGIAAYSVVVQTDDIATPPVVIRYNDVPVEGRDRRSRGRSASGVH